MADLNDDDDAESQLRDMAYQRILQRVQDQSGKPVTDNFIAYLANPNNFAGYTGYLNQLSDDQVTKQYFPERLANDGFVGGFVSEGPNRDDSRVAHSLQELAQNPDDYDGYRFDTEHGEDPRNFDENTRNRLAEIFQRNRDDYISDLAHPLVDGSATDEELSEMKSNRSRDRELGNELDNEIAKLRIAQKQNVDGYSGRPYTIQVEQVQYNGKPAYSIKQVYK